MYDVVPGKTFLEKPPHSSKLLLFALVSLHRCLNCRDLWHLISLIPSERDDIFGLHILTESFFPDLMLFPILFPQTTKSVVSDKHIYQLRRSQVVMIVRIVVVLIV
jgi:hypothetical protein